MKKKKKRAVPRIVHNGVTIREVRPNYWMIDIARGGKRERKCFRSLDDAKVEADALAVAIRNEGASVLDLSPAQRADAVAALKELNGGASLLAAAKFWMRHNGMSDGVSVETLADRWIKALRAQGCRETTLREREHKTGRLTADLGQRPVASVTRDDLISWMDEYRLKGATRDGYRRCYRAMLQFAVDERMIDTNPAAAIKAIRMDEKMPVPFTVEQTASIMAAAERWAPIMVPTLAVQFFAGLRPGEAKGLQWTAIDLEENTISITPETSKVRRSRIIDMNPAARVWLEPYKQKSGAVGVETQNQFDFYMTRKDCGGKPGVIGAAGVKWIQDGPRKTFASMHYATNEDAARLAAILGHTGGHDVLFRHYRGLMGKKDAARFWDIRPAVTEKGKAQ